MQTHRRFATVVLTLGAAWTAGCGPSSPFAEQTSPRLKTAPTATFRAGSLLGTQALRGRNYLILDQVPLIDEYYLFSIQTSEGVIQAHGLNMLTLRLEEMRSVELAERINTGSHVARGGVDSLRKTTEGLGEILTDPAGTLIRAPGGVERAITEQFDPADRRAGSLVRRQLAAAIGCDPETSNPILKRMLDSMALRRKLGELATGGALGLAVPGAGLLSGAADIKHTVQTTLPHEINAGIENRLLQMGIPQDLAREFIRQPHFTTTQRMVFMWFFGQLQHVAGRAAVVTTAAQARDEAEALGVIHQTVLLAQLAQRRTIRQLTGTSPVVAVLDDDTLVAVRTADYLYNPQPAIDAVNRCRTARPETPAALVITGRFAPQAAQALVRAGIRPAENGRLTW
ncbi:MAG: hypothetical protein KA354_18910 [Phycisphaerae bacterium]|nr:hypothetical protein [Phycisphaerae bacterium]